MKDLVNAYTFYGLRVATGLLFGIQIILVLFAVLFHQAFEVISYTGPADPVHAHV